MAKFAHHIFVCGNQRPPGSPRGCCDPQGREVLCRLLRAELKRQGAGPLVRANKSGCLDQCEHGPTLVIYPQEIWYGGVAEEDVPRIVSETILGGRVLSDLLIADERLNQKALSEPPQPMWPAAHEEKS